MTLTSGGRPQEVSIAKAHICWKPNTAQHHSEAWEW